MKPRKVMIHLEVMTDVPLEHLRDKQYLNPPKTGEVSRVWKVHQVTVQVVREGK